MYIEDYRFITPPDNTKIWRYMDFIKFVDIIDRKKLFFPTIDRLEDPFEGSFPKAYIDYFNANLDKIFNPTVWSFIDREHAPESFSRARRQARKFICVSCWNMQKEESAALWKLYCSIYNGIAIQSTIKKLKNSLKNERRDIYIGKVRYIDHYSQPPSKSLSDDLFPNPYLYKGKSFSFEKEVRVIIELPRLKKTSDDSAEFISGHTGYDAVIDPQLLIEKIYLSPIPSNNGWQERIIKLLLEKYGYNNSIVQPSNLNRKPIY